MEEEINLRYIEVDNNNLELAIKLQNEISETIIFSKSLIIRLRNEIINS